MDGGGNPGWQIGTRGLAAALLLLLALPPIGLALSIGALDFTHAVEHGLWTALTLSLRTSAITAGLLLVLGTPLAWVLSRLRDRVGRALELLVQLPAVTPPAVAGVALLTAFGRSAPLGAFLDEQGLGVPFTTGAVVLAQLFVATPFYVLPLREAFAELDEDLLWTARSLGASPARAFFRVALPLTTPTLLSGLAVAWARAIGEFGATLVFAGSFEGVTRTLPIAIYTTMESDLGAARALAVSLMAVALLVFLVLRLSGATGGRGRR